MPELVIESEPLPAEQFDDAAQQRHASTLGMWTFLATEVLFFGALFVGFYAMRMRWPDDFASGAHHLKWYLGAINTAVLLTSSFFMAMAVHAAAHGDRQWIGRWLLLTLALGLAFLAIKFTEYAIEYHERLLPYWHYSPVDETTGTPRADQLPLFMSAYFITTAFHALHVTIGLGALSILWFMNRRGRFGRSYHTPVEMVGLYWHFVDVVWVFLFPTLYLLRHG
jgi:cytochrome c oxidase subunit 3